MVFLFVKKTVLYNIISWPSGSQELFELKMLYMEKLYYLLSLIQQYWPL